MAQLPSPPFIICVITPRVNRRYLDQTGGMLMEQFLADKDEGAWDQSLSDLRNAMLYADRVNWVSYERLFALTEERILDVHRHLSPKIVSDQLLQQLKAAADIAGIFRPAYERFCADLQSSGTASSIREVFGTGPLEPDHAPRINFNKALASATEEARLIVRPTQAVEVSGWSSYDAATHLMQAITRLLLPDVSSLPLDAIGEMKDRLRASLEPMRAELLRFTENLRELIGDKAIDSATLDREAVNLVASRIEPVVREANFRARELAERKWRKLYVGAAKAFGLTGAALVDAKLFSKAIQQTLEVAALAFADAEDESPKPTGSATAQFVLEAWTLSAQRQCV